MEEFKKLQVLWQTEPVIETPAPADLGPALQRYRRRHALIYTVKAFAALFLIGCMLAVVGKSLLAVFGIILLAAGVAAFAALDLKAQSDLAAFGFAAPSTEFARRAAENMRRLEEPPRAQKLLLLLAPLLSVNLILSGLLSVPMGHRAMAHLCASLAALAGYVIGLRGRALRIRKEFRPLLDRLEAFQRSNG